MRTPSLNRYLASWRMTLLAVVLAWTMPTRAAHYSGASITYECLGGGQYLIHLDLFLDCSGFAMVPQTLEFQSDCGTSFQVNSLAPPVPNEVSQLCPSELANSTCNGGALPGIMHYQFETQVFLNACNDWTISWDICCRNNTQNVQGNPGMYVEATINTAAALCDNSPVFTDQSLPYVCVNQQVDYNFGVTEPDGDSLVYSLIDARFQNPPPTSVNYFPGFTGPSPIPGIMLDPVTGQLTFTPTVIGNYVVVVLVEQYDANGVFIGTVMRDILFVVMSCANNAPTAGGVTNNTGGTITGPTSIEVCEGEPFCVDIVFADADPGTVLQVLSQATTLLPGATFTVTGANPATATLCWTGDPLNSPVNVLLEANDGSCPIVNTVSVALNIISVDGGGPLPDPGTDSAVDACAAGPTVDLFAALGGAPDAGGVWTAPGGVPHSSTFDPFTDATGAYVYTVGNACATATATVTVTILQVPDAGGNGTLDLCSNSAAQGLFAELAGAPDAGGTWTAPGGAAFSGTYDPAVNAPGIYVYTVGANGVCPAASATVTVNELSAPNAGADATLDLCSTSAPTSLFGLLVGAQGGGAWTDPLGAPVGALFDPSSDAPGVYTYTVPGTAPCLNDQATVTVTVQVQPVAGVNGSIAFCSTDAAQALQPVLGATSQAGGTWTAPGGGAFTGSYDPALNGPGAYVYTITAAAPCANANATVTVTENLSANAGVNGALSFCSSDAPLGLIAGLGGSPQAGGSWTAPGGGAFSGSYDPAADAPGIYTYTVLGTAPCANAGATVTVTESIAPDAGTDGSLSLCSSAAPAALFASLGGAQAGGSWTAPGGAAFSGTFDPATDAPGTYTYTVNGTAPCVNDQATVVVTVTASPNAGADAALTLCADAAPVDIFTLLAGAQAGGSWTAPGGVAFGGVYDPATDAPGVYIYLVPAVAPCANDQATVTVTEMIAANAGADAAVTICDQGAPVNLFTLLLGAQAGGTWTGPGGSAFNGTFDPAIHGSGTFTYTVTGIAPCANDQATVTVTETGSPNAGVDATITLCSTGVPADLFNSLVGAQPGGTWTGPGGVFSGIYDPATDVAGVYTYFLSAAAPCVSDQATVTVTEVVGPNAGTSTSVSVCDPGAQISLFTLLNGASPGGTWNAPGGGAFAGIYDPVVNAPGIFTYTVNGTAPCPNAQSTVTVTENPAADAGLDGSITLCSNTAAVDLLQNLVGAQTGGTWTAPGGVAFSGTFDPAVDAAGIYTYTVIGLAPCVNDQASVTVSVVPAVDAGTDGTITVCDQGGPVDLFTVLVGAQPGGAWTGPGGAAFSGTYDPQLDGPGAYTYSLTGAAPCANDQAVVTVFETGSPNAGVDAVLTLCSSDPAQDLFALLVGAQPGGAWTDPLGGTFSGTYDPAIGYSGVYTYSLAATAPCVSDQATVSVTEFPAPNAGIDAAVTVCTSAAPFALFSVLGGTPDPGGTWTDPNGAPYFGPFVPLIAPAGAYTYTVTSPFCPSDQSTATVIITAGPDAGQSATISACSSGAPLDLFAALGGTPDSTGWWTGPGGATMNGTVDPAVDPAGVYQYTVPGAGSCPGDQSTVNLSIGQAGDAGTDGASTLCSASQPVDLFTLLGGTPDPGGAWTGPGGGAVSALFAPSTGAVGNYVYTVSPPLPCPSVSATVTMAVTQAPFAGADAVVTFCSSDASQSLFALLGGAPQAGGFWSGPNGTVPSGTFQPATDAPGAYVYTVDGNLPCVADIATVQVSVSAVADAGAPGSATSCSNGPLVNLFQALGGTPQTGGVWTGPGGSSCSATLDPSTAVSGAYVYTVSAPAPCPQVSSAVDVVIIPVPEPVITSVIGSGCLPVEVVFSTDQPVAGSCLWDLGNGETSTQCGGASVVYDVAGSYLVSLTIDVGSGCTSIVTASSPIEVAEEPTAAFTSAPDVITTNEPLVTFQNNSLGASVFLWSFGTFATSTAQEPVIEFPSELSDSYLVCLTAVVSPTCFDTSCALITVEPGAGLFVPNAFSPDGDGINDRFFPVLQGIDRRYHRFLVFDRWGQALFDTADPEAQWDGRFPNGDPVPGGVYVWKITGKDAFSGERLDRSGSVTLVR